MATYTTYELGDSISATSGGNAAGFPAPTVLTGEFDSARRNLVAADVIELIDVPAGTLVKNVFYEVLVGEAAQTLDIGDGVDPDGYVAVAAVATAGSSGIGAGALAGGKYYSAADTIDLAVPATKAYTVLRVRVYVECTILGLG